MPPIAKACALNAPKKILLITKLIWGTKIASAIGSEMANICLLLMVTCKEGVACELLIFCKSTISFSKELHLFLYHCIRIGLWQKRKLGYIRV